MKIGLLICLLLLTFPAIHAFQETPAFEKARQLGAGKFFLFSTSHGKYTIRDDGMSEISAKRMHLFFYLRVGRGGRLEQVYFHEYQGDLLLLYEVSNGRGGIAYLTRVNPQNRMTRWVTAIDVNKVGPCSIEDDAVSCGPTDDSTTINLKTGAAIKTTSPRGRASSSSTTSLTHGLASSTWARERQRAA